MTGATPCANWQDQITQAADICVQILTMNFDIDSGEGTLRCEKCFGF